MKKRSLFALCLIALVSIAVLASCFLQDPITDNKAIGKWKAQNNMGDKVTLEVKPDKTLEMTLEQTSDGFLEEYGLDDSEGLIVTVTGKWDADSVSQGTMTLDELSTKFTFTAYDNELDLTNTEMGTIKFSRI